MLNALRNLWVPAAIFFTTLAFVFCFWIGPPAIYLSSLMGLLCAFCALVERKNRPAHVAGRGVPALLIVVSLFFFLAAFILDILFLRPLNDSARHMPRLTQTHTTESGMFDVRTPQGWTSENIHGSGEAGLRLRPSDKEQYIGVAELTVRVRELQGQMASRPDFLRRMAETFSSDRKIQGEKLFEFSMKPAQLLDGHQGLWSKLLVKRFWVPITQFSLIGIKNKRYLCTVSATGLENHSMLSEGICLSVYETIRINPPEK